jgi:hypothetical protein
MKMETIFKCEAMSHDLFSTKFCRDGKADTLSRTDYKEPQVVCYAIEGNIVDRASSQNGKGWCENVIPALNTQDRHAICYGISRSCLKGGNRSNGGMPVGENIMPTMTAQGTGAVCHEK